MYTTGKRPSAELFKGSVVHPDYDDIIGKLGRFDFFGVSCSPVLNLPGVLQIEVQVHQLYLKVFESVIHESEQYKKQEYNQADYQPEYFWR